MQTILLVEDDEVVRRVFHNYLESCGYNLIEACDGEEALLLADLYEDPIEYLVTDLVMPKLGGLELAKKILQIRPSIQPVFMSGYCPEANQVNVIAKAPIVLMKPFRPKDLVVAIKKAAAIEGLSKSSEEMTQKRSLSLGSSG